MVMSVLGRVLPSASDVRSERDIVERARLLLKVHHAEMEDGEHYVGLNRIHQYLMGQQEHPSLPAGATPEVRKLAKMSRVNVLDLIVSSIAQALYVDGYRAGESSMLGPRPDEAPAWQVWQANRMDRRQSGIHRAALAYGTSYVTVLPGTPLPVIRGHSPRRMVAVYGDDDEWPVSALQIEPSGGHWALRLFESGVAHRLSATGSLGDVSSEITYLETETHGSQVTPVVRYLNVVDLDEEHQGEIERLIPIQDQIDDTTFSMLVAQRYAAFRQRYVIGWTDATEEQKLKASAARLWLFEDDVKVGEFEQTDLKGYLDSRESSLRHAATISQTPAHELIGQMVNLSAEALVAAEASQRRKVTERQMSFGESHEQALMLSGQYAGFEVEAEAQVRWRDTESRALSQTVDALGKMAQMLGIPPQVLWERIPGVSQQDVQAWRDALNGGDPVTHLLAEMQRQAEVAA